MWDSMGPGGGGGGGGGGGRGGGKHSKRLDTMILVLEIDKKSKKLPIQKYQKIFQ